MLDGSFVQSDVLEYIICSPASSSDSLRGETVSTSSVGVSVPLEDDDELVGLTLGRALIRRRSIISSIETTSTIVGGCGSTSTGRSD